MMTRRFNFIRFPLVMILFGFLSACSLTTQTLPTPLLEPSGTPLPVAETTSTVEQVLVETPSGAQGPACTVLQDLNLRTGPGTAYRPPTRVLPEGTVVTPIGFNPTGIPSGSWANVEDPTSGDKGWVNAGTQYISCNINLASLPSVVVGTPLPPPPPKSVISSVPEGSCGEGGIAGKHGNIYDCAVEVVDGLPIQFVVLKDNQEIGSADGIENVVFLVKRDDKVIYTRTESNKDYCLFGGDGPCDPWVIEDYASKWEQGGASVEAGEYEISMDVSLEDEPDVVLHWDAIILITLQQ